MKKFEWKRIKQRIGKGKKRIIAVTVSFCLVAAAAGNAVSKQSRTKAEDNKAISTTVRTGTIQESVSGTGTISYASSTDVEVPSDLEIDEVLVSEGTYVEEGTLLATVDATSLAVCTADVQDEISSLDDTITSELSSTTTKYITAGVSGTVEEIYGQTGDNVADVMVEHGALMLVKNGDETIKVIGSEGAITAVNVSEGGTVSSSTKVYTLESDTQSGEYLQAVKDREELVSILETLISIKKNGGIVASVEGMVETINVSEASSNSSSGSSSGAVSGASVGMSTDAASRMYTDLSSSYTSAETDSVSELSSVDADDDSSIHSIPAVTLTNLSSGDALSSGTLNAYGTSEKTEALKALKAGTGRIEGTTKDMEYASDKDADTWTECSDDYTGVATGTWYVRYKATDTENASEAVELVVSEKTDSSNGSSDTSDSSDSSESSSSKTGTSKSSTTDGSDNSGSSNSGVGDSSQSSSTDNTGSDSKSGNSTSGNNGSGNGSSNSDSSGNGKSGSGSSGSKSGSGSNSGSGGSSSGSKGNSSGSSSSGSGSSGGSSSGNSSAYSTVSAFTIANGDKMKVTMNVDELDILTMEEGLSAEITLDAVENKTFEGTITNVSGSASSSNGTAQYPVEITFDKTEEMLSGMNASVEVIISEAKDVLTIPLAAVSDEGRSSYVYTGYDESSGELTGKTEVTLGMSDDNSVEVTEGLSEGDTIYYEMRSSDSSDSKSGKSGMGGMGMPGMNGSGDMKMGGDRPSGGNGGERPSGGNGDRPSGGSSKGN